MNKRILITLVLGLVLAPSALADEPQRVSARNCGYGQKSMECYADGRPFFCDRQRSQKLASQSGGSASGGNTSSISAN